jgi:hypothetical protein
VGSGFVRTPTAPQAQCHKQAGHEREPVCRLKKYGRGRVAPGLPSLLAGGLGAPGNIAVGGVIAQRVERACHMMLVLDLRKLVQSQRPVLRAQIQIVQAG